MDERRHPHRGSGGTTVEPVAELSLDYEPIVSLLGAPPDPAAVGAALLTALTAHYAARHPAGTALHEFQQGGATYLFDLASAALLPQEDRTVAAWALTPADIARRDAAYQRGFPLAPRQMVQQSIAATSSLIYLAANSDPTSFARTGR
jgi:hypothetical protein